MTPEERILRAKLAANARWAQTDDRSRGTSAARTAFEERFVNEVDPDRTLAPAERAKRAANARKAYFAALALKSSVARRKRTAREATFKTIRTS